MIVLPEELFEAPLPGLQRALTRAEGELAANYLNVLTKWQRTHRLVGSTDVVWLIDNVLLDSIAFLAGVPDGTESIVDIGSGAGVPGIPISIVKPDISVSLVEARGRRVSFLSTVIRQLQLARVVVVHSRAEALGGGYLGRFDVAVMRCAGRSEAMLPGAMRLVRAGGAVVVAGPPAPRNRKRQGSTQLTVQTRRGARSFQQYIKAPNFAVDR